MNKRHTVGRVGLIIVLPYLRLYALRRRVHIWRRRYPFNRKRFDWVRFVIGGCHE